MMQMQQMSAKEKVSYLSKRDDFTGVELKPEHVNQVYNYFKEAKKSVSSEKPPKKAALKSDVSNKSAGDSKAKTQFT